MVIGHFKRTPIAYAPEAVANVINKYTEHRAYVFGIPPFGGIQPNTTIYHQHNIDAVPYHPKLIQYHSEPFRVDLNVNIPQLVIAQYQATLPEYKNCIIVRNPVDLFELKFLPKYNCDKIRIGYSPSTVNKTSEWADKGYVETIPILKKLKREYKDLIDIDVIINTPFEECLYRKSLCNVFIDEVKTASYHRSGLESLAMGQLTICSVSPEVEVVMLEASGANALPFVNVHHTYLYETLVGIIEQGMDSILARGFASRRWMEKYWSPSTIAEEYVQIYENIINKS